MNIKQFILRKKNLILLTLILLGYFILRPAPSFKSQIQKSDNIKGVWVTNIATSFFHHTTLLDNVFYHLAKSGYTHVYVSAYSFGGKLYPSKHVKSNPLVVPPFTDVLKASEKEAQRQGLKLYAWLEYGLMLMPNDSIALNHPDWLLKTASGKTVVDGFVWLNPQHPEVQTYILAMIEEVSKYKGLTGIQFDDHWSVPHHFGNHSTAMNKLTARVKQRLEEINPDLIFSLSPNPYSFSKEKYNQDWLKWAKRGYIDEVVIQIYRTNAQEFEQSILTSQIHQLPKSMPVAIGIYAGSVGNFKTSSEIQKQIDISENLGYGFSIFCWEYRFMGSI
jgi:uncharacterized lipoprotein YddW (UPF0748 family)